MILIIGEKPSVSRAISAVVGASSAHKGYTEGNGYIVSWCVGHLVGLKYPNDYGNGWDQKWSFSQLPMLPEKWQFRVTDSTKAQYELLKKLMNSVDVSEIICATDADREGECIFRYVYNMARCRKPVKRLWVSSLEESAIRKALTTMKPMSAYDNLFNAGYARARADWLVGMNGSRLFSVRYHKKYTSLEGKAKTKYKSDFCYELDEYHKAYKKLIELFSDGHIPKLSKLKTELEKARTDYAQQSAERKALKKEADRLSRLAQQKRDSQRTLARYIQNEQAAKRKKSQLE